MSNTLVKNGRTHHHDSELLMWLSIVMEKNKWERERWRRETNE
ncbi:hypothetical protein HanRHA438_Chr15g0684381 [Helianthus annuus]|nr:hypothetical protein HanRHA438_Chr15g0684381 [Helianthus annuus]